MNDVSHTLQTMVDTSHMDTTTHDPHTYGGRLGLAIESAQITVRDLAKHLDVSPQSLYKVLRGESKSLQVANHLKACKFLGIEPKWLSDGAGTMAPSKALSLEDNPDYPAIRHVAMKFSAGVTGYEVQQVGDDSRPIVFKASWFKARGLKPHRMLAVTVSGQSMEPTLYDGDLVVINLDDTAPRDGEVFAARYEDELVLKRVFREGGSWWLHSDNADQRRYPRREAGAGVEILGRVVYRQSERL